MKRHAAAPPRTVSVRLDAELAYLARQYAIHQRHRAKAGKDTTVGAILDSAVSEYLARRAKGIKIVVPPSMLKRGR